MDRADLERELVALTRGNSSLLSGLDVMRIQAGAPEGEDPEASNGRHAEGHRTVETEGGGPQDRMQDRMQECMEEEEGSPVPMEVAAGKAAAQSQAAGQAAGQTTEITPPEAADVGRRLLAFWVDEGEWFPGVLAAIEAGHDDGEDAGDYRVLYDDGDELWEPLGSRTPYKWAGGRVLERLPCAPSPGSGGGAIGDASSSQQPTTPPNRPRQPKRVLSERSHLVALPEAKASATTSGLVLRGPGS